MFRSTPLKTLAKKLKLFAQPKSSLMLKSATTIGTGSAVIATGMALYKLSEKKTEETPITGLKLLYAKRFYDEEKRRQSGILPKELYKAAKIALTQGNIALACEWYKKMALVHPKQDEISLYQEAAIFLFENDHIDSAANLWKYTSNPSQLSARMIQVGNKFFEKNQISEAIKYWEKGANEDEMAVFLEKAGNAYRDMKKIKKAVYYWELAEKKGKVSTQLLTQLAHYHLTKLHRKGIEESYDYLVKIVKSNQANAITYNELGVTLYMNAIAYQGKETFYERRLQAMQYFKKALELEPNNEVIARNLEIIQILNNQAHFGFTHWHLTPAPDKPTFMFDAIIKGLQLHRTELDFDFGIGYRTDDVYDKEGNYLGQTGGVVPTMTSRTNPHVQTEIAIKDLLSLKMRWDEKDLLKKPEYTISTTKTLRV